MFHSLSTVVKTPAVVQPSQSMLLNPVFLALAILGKVVASTAVDCRPLASFIKNLGSHLCGHEPDRRNLDSIRWLAAMCGNHLTKR